MGAKNVSKTVKVLRYFRGYCCFGFPFLWFFAVLLGSSGRESSPHLIEGGGRTWQEKKRHWCNHCKICLYYAEWAHLWAIWISLWESYGWSKISWYMALLFLMWFYYASLSLLGSWSTSVLNYQVIWIMMNHFLEPETWPHRAPASRTDTQNLNWRECCSFSMHKRCSDAWICLSLPVSASRDFAFIAWRPF